MKKLKFTFKNAAGEELAGLLELPENPKAFALLGVSLDIENYCTLRLFFDLPNLAGLSRRNLPADGIRLLFHI